MDYIRDLDLRNIDMRDDYALADFVQELEKKRSDAAEEYLEKMILSLNEGHKVSIGDNKVMDLLAEWGLDVPDELITKTPDIMIYDKRIEVLFIGDVAVTNSPKRVDVYKSQKYSHIVDILAAKGTTYLVKNINFIVDRNIKEIEEVTRLKNIFLNGIGSSSLFLPILELDKDFLESIRYASSLLNAIIANSSNSSNVNRILEERRANEIELDIPEYKDVDHMMFAVEHSEQDLFDSIWNESISNDQSGYDQKTVLSMFDDIKNELNVENDKMESGKIKCPIPFVFFAREEEGKTGLEMVKEWTYDICENGVDDKGRVWFPRIDALDKAIKHRDSLKSLRENSSREELLQKVKEEFDSPNPYFIPLKGMHNPPKIVEQIKTILKKTGNKAPKTIHTINNKRAIHEAELLISMLGKQDKFLTNKYKLEEEPHTVRDRQMKDLLGKRLELVETCTFNILGEIYNKLANDVSYMPFIRRKGVYLSIPPNGSCINVIVLGWNQKTRDPHVSWYTIARSELSKNEDDQMFSENVIERHRTDKYVYYITRLQKYNLGKIVKMKYANEAVRTACLSLSVIADENMGTEENMLRTIGLMSLLAFDLHQTPNNLVDLMKYLVGMSTGLRSNLPKLLKDNMAVMRKTSFDVWLVENILKYVKSNLENGLTVESKKRTGKDQKGYKIKSKWTSIIGIDHWSNEYHLAEGGLMNQLRPKSLTGKQFINKNIQQTIEFNLKQKRSREQSTFAYDGIGSLNELDYSMSHIFSRDAIIHAQTMSNNELASKKTSCLVAQYYETKSIALKGLSMRGACKTHEAITSNIYNKKSETSLYEALVNSRKEIDANNTERMRVINFVRRYHEGQMVFNMSQKQEERTKGRAIGSPDFATKQKLRFLESIYKKRGSFQNENMLIKGINKMANISNMVRDLEKRLLPNEKIYHMVMDQSKFSEGDNIRKFMHMIVWDDNIDKRIKFDLVKILSDLENRIQYYE